MPRYNDEDHCIEMNKIICHHLGVTCPSTADVAPRPLSVVIRTWYGVTRCGAGAVHDSHSPDSEGSLYSSGMELLP